MAKLVEFGAGQVYFLTIDQNTGVPIKQAAALVMSSYVPSTRILTIAAITNTEILQGDNVIISFVDDGTAINKYSFGKVNNAGKTEILIDDEADDSWITSAVMSTDAVNVFKGVAAGLFENAMVELSSTGVEFKGTNKFTREIAYTDVDYTVTVESIIFNDAVFEYILGMNVGSQGNGIGLAVMDNQYGESIRPIDVAVLIIKQKTGNEGKYEEVVCPRVKSASLSLPFSRNEFTATDYEFTGQKKSSGDNTILTYTV